MIMRILTDKVTAKHETGPDLHYTAGTIVYITDEEDMYTVGDDRKFFVQKKKVGLLTEYLSSWYNK